MSYDQKCLDLATFWLDDENMNETFIRRVWTEKDKDKLAQVIQDAIEDFVEFENPGKEGGVR